MVGRDIVEHPLTAKELRKPVLDLIREYQRKGLIPTNGRFIFYDLVSQGIISKEKRVRTDGKVGRLPEGNLNECLTWLRKHGEVPWDDMKDYRVLIASTNGQCAGFLRTDIKPLLYPDIHIPYFGDWD